MLNLKLLAWRLLTVFFAVNSLFLLSGCSAKETGALSTIRQMIDAVEKMDVGKTAQYFAPALREDVKSTMRIVLEDVKTITISDISVELKSRHGNQAVAKVAFDLNIQTPDFPYLALAEDNMIHVFEEGHNKEEIRLRKDGKDWFIERYKPPNANTILDRDKTIVVDGSVQSTFVGNSEIVKSPGFLAQLTGEVKRALAFDRNFRYVKWYALPTTWNNDFSIAQQGLIHEDLVKPIVSEWSQYKSKDVPGLLLRRYVDGYYRVGIKRKYLTDRNSRASKKVTVRWNKEEIEGFNSKDHPVLLPMKTHEAVYISRQAIKRCIYRMLDGKDE